VLKSVVTGRSPAISVRLVDVRYSGLYFLDRKSTRCISHISTDSVRLVDVRYSVLYFLAKKVQDSYRTSQPSATSPLFLDNLHFGQIAKSVNHQSRLTLLAICPKWRLSKKKRTSCRRLAHLYQFGSVGRCAISNSGRVKGRLTSPC